MSKKLSTWRINRIRGSRADRLGRVQAPDSDTAINLAIKKYDITDPQEQSVSRRCRMDRRREPISLVEFVVYLVVIVALLIALVWFRA